MSSGIFNIGLNNANGSLVLTKSGTMTLDFSQTGPAGYQVPSARTVTAGVGLTGGGSLTSDITIDAEFGTTAGTICQGNDARLSDARTPTSHTHPASEISDSTAAGRTILTAADAAAQRTALGLGTVATQDANNVTLTGGTLQGVGVVTGSYTSNANEAILRSCRKASAGTITKGQVVYIVGSTGVHLTVELSDADTESTSSKTFGIAAENITNSTEGYVMVEGLLTGLSNLPSTSFADGDALWLSSTTGGWQNTPPANPAHGVYLGRVIKASNGSNAQAYIRIQNGYELNELHDVVIASPLDTHSVYYETATQLWKNRAAANADLAAITVFPRFDANQSATATQKRTARENIGFRDTFTVSELRALSVADSERLRFVYCSDCISSKGLLSDAGDFAYWNGLRWVNAYDRCYVTTSLAEFFLWKYLTIFAANGVGTNYMSVAGNFTTAASGTGAAMTTNNFPVYDGRTTNGAVSTTGSTASGVARVTSGGFPITLGFGQRTLATVVGFNSVDASAAPDTWHLRHGIENFQNTATAAIQADMGCLHYDPDNILGQGSTGSNFFAFTRGNSTRFDYVDTGISNSTPHYQVVVMEITAANQVRFTIATALSNGASFQSHVQRTLSVTGGNLSAAHCFAKATGTNAKLAYKTGVPAAYAFKANNINPTTFVS